MSYCRLSAVVTYVDPVSEVFDASALAAGLPGTWTIAATNFPMWLDGSRRKPEITYEIVESADLTLSDIVSYVTSSGETKTIIGTDRLRGDEFVWRGKGWLTLLTSRWHVVGADDAFDIAVIRFTRSRFTPAGIDVLVRKTTSASGVRSTVAHSSAEFGISAEEFASLTWL